MILEYDKVRLDTNMNIRRFFTHKVGPNNDISYAVPANTRVQEVDFLHKISRIIMACTKIILMDPDPKLPTEIYSEWI